MILPKPKENARKLNDILESVKLIPIHYGDVKTFGNLRPIAWGNPEVINDKTYLFWTFIYDASPDETKEIELFYDNEDEEDKVYFGREKVINNHSHDVDMTKDILEGYVKRIIPKKRKRWLIEKINKGASIDSMLDAYANFYSNKERTILQRYFRMLPVLARIFEKIRERELVKKQEELMQDSRLKELIKKIEKKSPYSFEEFEKIDAEHNISELTNPDEKVNILCEAYKEESEAIHSEIDAYTKLCAEGKITRDDAKKQFKELEKKWNELDNRYSKQWTELRRAMRSAAGRYPENFINLLMLYSQSKVGQNV